MFQYFDKILRGTQNEDSQIIVQSLKGMIGKRFSFLNYYKEIPVSYDATLVSVENEMAEFEVHEYQAKVIGLERKALMFRPDQGPFSDDIFGESFYVNVAKKRVILCKFSYAKIRSDMRRYVRVVLDRPVHAELDWDAGRASGAIRDISLGGAAMAVADKDILQPGLTVQTLIQLPDLSSNKTTDLRLTSSVVRIIGDAAPYTCLLEFHQEKQSQQQISYFINQRQVEIIKELKELTV